MGTGDLKQESKETRYHAKMARAIAKKGTVLLDLDDQIDNPRMEGALYTELRIRMGAGEHDEVLAMLKRETGDGKEIAFHYGASVGEAIEGIVNRLRNGSLKWREDRPYEAR